MVKYILSTQSSKKLKLELSPQKVRTLAPLLIVIILLILLVVSGALYTPKQSQIPFSGMYLKFDIDGTWKFYLKTTGSSYSGDVIEYQRFDVKEITGDLVTVHLKYETTWKDFPKGIQTSLGGYQTTIDEFDYLINKVSRERFDATTKQSMNKYTTLWAPANTSKGMRFKLESDIGQVIGETTIEMSGGKLECWVVSYSESHTTATSKSSAEETYYFEKASRINVKTISHLYFESNASKLTLDTIGLLSSSNVEFGYTLNLPLIGGIAAVIIVVAVFLIRRRKAQTKVIVTPVTQPITPAQPTPLQPSCARCGKPLTFIPQYNRWYCYNCKQYA